ncbi:TPA: class I SAM-dependent methyltransferase family protein [Candidatus Avigastranaerophilus faecigallinarum]|nr:class I SAM-dependent methyltransferase family protein [Candidatus Avigastranaerophilus faecigallinarum]
MNKFIENAEISILKIIVDTLGQLSNGINLASKEGFTSGKMLDYIYKNEPTGKLGIGKLIDKIYLNHPGWQDVRTRKQNLVANLKEAVDLTLQEKGSARICDVASGPARYIIETLESYKDKAVTAELRDIDIRWLLEAKEAAESRGINIEYKTANALEDNDFSFEKQPDIMVASGFYDWFDDKEIIKKSMSLIYKALPQNGYFVFSIQAGHVALSLTNKIFKDFNNHQLKMVTWDMDIINSILKEIGFAVILTRSDDKGHYPVLLAKKV